MKDKTKRVNIPLALQFRRMPKSGDVRRIIHQQLDRFNSFVRPGARCEVVMDQTESTRSEQVYDVSVRLNVPGRRLYASHRTVTGASLEFLDGAVYAAFEDIKRQMVRHSLRRRRRQTLLPA
jgi:ribosome-associated translation inhibitor RaiA